MPQRVPRHGLSAAKGYGAFTEPCGRNCWQPVANGTAAKTARQPKPLPWVATGCRSERMVRGVDHSELHALGVRDSSTASLVPIRLSGWRTHWRSGPKLPANGAHLEHGLNSAGSRGQSVEGATPTNFAAASNVPGWWPGTRVLGTEAHGRTNQSELARVLPWSPADLSGTRRRSGSPSVTCYGVYSSALATGSLPHCLGVQFASLAPPTLRT